MSLYTRLTNLCSSLTCRLLSIFSFLTFLITSLLSTLYITTEIRESRTFVIEQLHMRAENLAAAVRLPLYAENHGQLRRSAEEASQAPEIRAVVITAPDGRILAEHHAQPSAAPTGMISQSVPVYSGQLADSVESSLIGARDADQKLVGAVRIERGTRDLTDAAYRLVLFTISLAVCFWLSVTLLCYPVLRRVTRSYEALMHGIGIMKEGDYSSRIIITDEDEPGRAAQSVNDLADALQQRDAENTRLQEEQLILERQMLHAQKLESLGIMAGGIAHDFNNLLQSVLGNMEMAVLKTPPESSSRKYLANALSSGKQAAHLTGLMLTYAGKGFISKKAVDLNGLIRENVSILQTAATTTVPVKLFLSPDMPTILADEAQLQQVVMNLIQNAAESIFVLPGMVSITTGNVECQQSYLAGSLLEEKPEPGSYVFMEISDNGCGMSEETLKRVFDPFFSTKFTGRGLGMSAVMGIVRTHKGALFVASEPGRGTTFRVLFPVPESPLECSSPEPVAPTPNGPLSGVALLADDDRSVLKVCAKMLTLSGFTVITACDGVDAVSKFREHADKIRIVLLDLTMPNMDGITAMGEIRSIRPDIKVILSSGFNEQELAERITCQGPSGFIRKPYNMNTLETELRRVLLES